MKTRILETFKITFLALLLTVGIGYVFAAWTPAPTNPPNGNTDAPINVGSSAQVKTGALTLGDLTSGYVTKFAIKDGSQGAGKVLTSDANGNAQWKDFVINDSDKFLDPIACYLYLNGTAYNTQTSYQFIISGTSATVPASGLASRGYCWYSSDVNKTPLDKSAFELLVSSGAYVGSLRGFMTMGSGALVPGSVGISGSGIYYRTLGLGPLNVSGLYVPTMKRIKEALQR